MEQTMEKLELLKKTIHPEKQMNIIDQCQIVATGLGFGSPYEEDTEGLATFLELSNNQVYKMNYTHHHMIPELKKWFSETEYQCHTAYSKAVLSREKQLEFLEGMNVLTMR
jgi:uncharacterized protein YihD (DUF1040 family)